MTDEPTHTASKERMAPESLFSSERISQLSNTALKEQWPLRFDFSYVQPITQCYKQKPIEEVPLQSMQSPLKYDDSHSPTINYCLESTAAIVLCFSYVCSACYTAL